MKSNPKIRNATREGWVHELERSVNVAVELLAGLVRELGPRGAFGRSGPEHLLVHTVLAEAFRSGGSVALDAIVRRLARRLNGLDPDGEALEALMGRIVDLTRKG